MYMWVSTNGGTPKWMLYKGISNIKMDDSGVPPFLETPIDVIYIYTYTYRYMPFTIAIKI